MKKKPKKPEVRIPEKKEEEIPVDLDAGLRKLLSAPPPKKKK